MPTLGLDCHFCLCFIILPPNTYVFSKQHVVDRTLKLEWRIQDDKCLLLIVLEFHLDSEQLLNLYSATKYPRPFQKTLPCSHFWIPVGA